MKLADVGCLLLASTVSFACSTESEFDTSITSNSIVGEAVQYIGVSGCAHDATPQFCEVAYSIPVGTAALLEVQYTVPSNHCSSVRVHYFLDGTRVYSSLFLGWVGGPVLGGLTTGFINLGPVAPGGHLVEVRAEGQVGGCNNGWLASWGGELRLRTN
jgi:hypothetical protein